MTRELQPAVYIMASSRNGTLYIGVTSNLIQRVWQHKEGAVAGFTTKYAVKTLVWYELHATMEHAIAREKALKKWNRAWKLDLIESANPDWRDLWPEIVADSPDRHSHVDDHADRHSPANDHTDRHSRERGNPVGNVQHLRHSRERGNPVGDVQHQRHSRETGNPGSDAQHLRHSRERGNPENCEANTTGALDSRVRGNDAGGTS